MTNTRTWILGLAVAGLTALGGCNLYFGDSHDDYTYCDETGCWWCDDYGCYPVRDGDGDRCYDNRDCAPGRVCGDRGRCEVPVGGSDCSTNADCPAGAYCEPELGICVGSWTCDAAGECPPGYGCDDRATCVPGACETDAECFEGCACVDGTCVETGVCERDDQCADGQTCDADRSTCTPCGDDGCAPADPGVCYAEPACDAVPPTCPDDTLPGVLDGCWSGFCIPLVLCPDEPPPPPVECRLIDTQAECEAEPTCRPVIGGTDCTYPDTGAPCEAGIPGCVCESVGFLFCTDRG